MNQFSESTSEWEEGAQYKGIYTDVQQSNGAKAYFAV